MSGILWILRFTVRPGRAKVQARFSSPAQCGRSLLIIPLSDGSCLRASILMLPSTASLHVRLTSSSGFLQRTKLSSARRERAASGRLRRCSWPEGAACCWS
jgi:hypothetical protein